MQATSATWRALSVDPHAGFEHMASVGGVHAHNYSDHGGGLAGAPRVYGGLFGDSSASAGVGNVCARQLDLSIYNLEGVGKNDRITLYTQLVRRDALTGAVEEQSETIEKGTFYVSTVQSSAVTGVTSIHAYDGVMRLETPILDLLSAKDVRDLLTGEDTEIHIVRLAEQRSGASLDYRCRNMFQYSGVEDGEQYTGVYLLNVRDAFKLEQYLEGVIGKKPVPSDFPWTDYLDRAGGDPEAARRLAQIAYDTALLQYQLSYAQVDWRAVGEQLLGSTTLRDVLGWIAAAHGCNVTITDRGFLRFIPLMSGDAYVYDAGTGETEVITGAVDYVLGDSDGMAIAFGEDLILTEPSAGAAEEIIVDARSGAREVWTSPDYTQWSGARCEWDGAVIWSVGATSGRVVVAKTPVVPDYRSGTPTLYDAVGRVFVPYSAEDALVDPAAELGDRVRILGVDSVIGSMDTLHDALCAADIAAPAADDVEDAAPAQTTAQKTLTAAARAATESGLQLRIVQTLPEGWASQRNVIWAIPG